MCIVFLNTDVALFFCCSRASFTRAVTMLRCVCVSGQLFCTLACPPFCRWIHIVYRFDDFVLTTGFNAIYRIFACRKFGILLDKPKSTCIFCFVEPKKNISGWFEFFCTSWQPKEIIIDGDGRWWPHKANDGNHFAFCCALLCLASSKLTSLNDVSG